MKTQNFKFKSKITFLIALLGVSTLISCNDDEIATAENNSIAEEAVLTKTLLGEEITYVRKNGNNIFQGDILLTDEDLNEETYQLKNGNTRAAVSTFSSTLTTSRKWPEGIIYYEMNDLNLYLTVVRQVLRAMEEFNSKTNVKFVRRTNQENYLTIRNSFQNISFVGMGVNGRQLVGLTNQATYGDILHSLGHATGLHHEINRSDRDEHVKILWDNIRNKHTYRIHRWVVPSGPFDINSVMMHDSYNNFSVDPTKPVIVRADNDETFKVQRSHLSEGDITAINTIYPK